MPRRPFSSILFPLALVTAADFLVGGALSSPIARHLPGIGPGARYAGTALLSGGLTVLLLVRFFRERSSGALDRLRLRDWRNEALLAAIAIFALWSRLSTLSWDATHGPDGYEEHFVSAVLKILREGSLNHGYHEYPGLFIYMLLGAYLVAFVTGVGARLGTTIANIPAAHFLAMGRALVAGFGVGNVLLTYPLGKKWFDARVGVFASALVAVSYLELYTSLYIRPDIVLETFFIGALLAAFLHLERGTLATAVLAGAAVGAATAVKYTGFLALFSLAVAVALAPASAGSRRLVRLILALGSVLVTYALLSPYTFLDLPGFLHGVAEQGLYNTDPSLQPAENMARYYTAVLARESIGYPALVLLVVGAARVMAAPRSRDLVALAFVVPYLAFFFASPAQFDRFLLPVQPALAALAGYGLDGIVGLAWLRRRKTLASAALAALALIPPSIATVRYLGMRFEPSVRDEVRDWALERLPPATRIGVSRLGPSFDGTPFAESRFVRLDESTYPLLVQFDFLVSAAIDDPDVVSRFREVARFEPRGPGGGQAQVVLQVPEAMKPRFRRIPLAPSQIVSALDAGQLPSLVDGNPGTIWRGGSPDRPQRIDVDLGEAREPSLVVLLVPREAVDAAARLRVQASVDGRNFVNARRLVIPESDPTSPDRSRVRIVLESRPARFLRLFEPRERDEDDGGDELELSEVELYEPDPR